MTRPRAPWHAPFSRRLARTRAGVPTLLTCAAVCAAALAQSQFHSTTSVPVAQPPPAVVDTASADGARRDGERFGDGRGDDGRGAIEGR